MTSDELRAQTPRELAECIWLRRYMTGLRTAPDPSGNQAGSVDTPDRAERAEALERGAREEGREHLPSDGRADGAKSARRANVGSGDASVERDSRGAQGLSGQRPHQGERLSSVAEVAMTRAPSPADSLTFKRLLHRLSETVDELTPQRVDLEATVRATASSGGVTLLESALERRKSTHLIWISDRSLHMSPWREVEDRILELLRSQSSFATTLPLEVDLSDPAPLRLTDRAGERVDLADSRHRGRELIVTLYTDGVNGAIADGRLGDVLRGLPRGSRVVWLHPWGLRHLNRTPMVKLSGSRPLSVSDELLELGYIPAALSELSDHGGFALSRWVHYHSPDALSARLIPIGNRKNKRARPRRARAVRRPERSWSDRAKNFARSASSGAMELLALASAVPSLFNFSADEIYALGYHFIEADGERPEPTALRLYLAEALTSGFLMRSGDDRLKFVDAEAQRVITSYVDYITLRHVLLYMIEQAEAESDTAEGELKLRVLIALRDRDAEGLAALLSAERYPQVEGIALVFGVKLISAQEGGSEDFIGGQDHGETPKGEGEQTSDELKVWIYQEANRTLAKLYTRQRSLFAVQNYFDAFELLTLTVDLIEQAAQAEGLSLDELLSQDNPNTRRSSARSLAKGETKGELGDRLNEKLNENITVAALSPFWDLIESTGRDIQREIHDIQMYGPSYKKVLEYAFEIRNTLAHRPNSISEEGRDALLVEATDTLTFVARELIKSFRATLEAPFIITDFQWSLDSLNLVRFSGYKDRLKPKYYKDQVVELMTLGLSCRYCGGAGRDEFGHCYGCSGIGKTADHRLKRVLWSCEVREGEITALVPVRLKPEIALVSQELIDAHDELRSVGLSDQRALEEMNYLIALRVISRPDLHDQLSTGDLWTPLAEADEKDVLELYSTLLMQTFSDHMPAVRELFSAAETELQDAQVLSGLIDRLSGDEWSTASLDEVYRVSEERLRYVAGSRFSELHMTPAPLVRAIVKALQPQPGEVITDLAAGTGSFLFGALDQVKQRYNHANGLRLQGVELSRSAHHIAQFRALLTNGDLMLKRGDSLSTLVDELSQSDLILCAPPWGRGAQSNPNRSSVIMSQSELYTSQFLQVIIAKLKPRGRAAVIVPSDFLSSTGPDIEMRTQLLRRCTLHTVLKLPAGALSYTQSSSDVLFFQKIERRGELQGSPIKVIELDEPERGSEIDYTHVLEAYGGDPNGAEINRDHALVSFIEAREIQSLIEAQEAQKPPQGDLKTWRELQLSFSDLATKLPAPLSRLSQLLGEEQGVSEAIERLIDLIDAYLTLCAAVRASEALERSSVHTSEKDTLLSVSAQLSQFSEGISYPMSWRVLKAQATTLNDEAPDGPNRLTIDIEALDALIESEDYHYHEFRNAWIEHLDAEGHAESLTGEDLKYTLADLVSYGSVILSVIRGSFVERGLSLEPRTELDEIVLTDEGTYPRKLYLVSSEDKRALALSPILIYRHHESSAEEEGVYVYTGAHENAHSFRHLESNKVVYATFT